MRILLGKWIEKDLFSSGLLIVAHIYAHVNIILLQKTQLDCGAYPSTPHAFIIDGQQDLKAVYCSFK